ncbi:MAG: class I SAM-dependent methyltransferase, partial [Caldilineaceae bacterium]|nr:class I SAM-dependent methyltransferase [Caldilineaceae bacterium]
HYGFNFRDINTEAAVLLAAADRLGNGGRHFIEFACGDCPYAETLMQAGVTYHGLDLSPEMLAFSQARLQAAGLPTAGILHLADMRDFALPQRFDLAFVLMGSLHFLDNAEFLRHLDHVHAHLNPGGLYVLEWCIEYAPSVEQQSDWTEESPLGEVGVRYWRRQRSALRQSFDERIEFTVNGDLAASSTDIVHLRYPNEFALLLQSRHSQWEMVGQFNAWDLEAPIGDDTQAINRPLRILKRRLSL